MSDEQTTADQTTDQTTELESTLTETAATTTEAEAATTEPTTEPTTESTPEPTPEPTPITEATVHDAAEHIVQVLPISYAAAECQARQMTAAERVTACNLKTGNEMQSHFFDVSQRIAKADRKDNLAAKEAAELEAKQAAELADEQVKIDMSNSPVGVMIEPGEKVEPVEDNKPTEPAPETKPTPKKKRK